MTHRVRRGDASKHALGPLPEIQASMFEHGRFVARCELPVAEVLEDCKQNSDAAKALVARSQVIVIKHNHKTQ